MLSKKSILLLLVTVSLVFSNLLWAHNPEFSSIIISKTENGQIVLQLNSSLTAFQQEINYIHGEGAYKSPEEFQELVLQLFRSRFFFILNNNDTLQFKNPKVILGHETKIIAEIIDLPLKTKSIELRNEIFYDLYNSQSAVIFSLNEFPKTKYTLNKENLNTINVSLEDGKWIDNNSKSTKKSLTYLPFVLTFIIGGLLFFLIKK
ncbi:hypothetical protein [Maribacter sp.]|uniref:hypothetical protein n=1 Tax=Maribacter sp. TaxID=1897614 RepID=UPI0032986927